MVVEISAIDVAFLSVTRESDRCLVASKVRVAESFWQRFRGLMLVPALGEGEGLLLNPCNQIHMMFMRFPIDAVFLDSKGLVVALHQHLRPWWGLSGWHRQAEQVLEITAGTVEKVKLQPGDRLVFATTG